MNISKIKDVLGKQPSVTCEHKGEGYFHVKLAGIPHTIFANFCEKEAGPTVYLTAMEELEYIPEGIPEEYIENLLHIVMRFANRTESETRFKRRYPFYETSIMRKPLTEKCRLRLCAEDSPSYFSSTEEELVQDALKFARAYTHLYSTMQDFIKRLNHLPESIEREDTP